MILLRITACCLACCAAIVSVAWLYPPQPEQRGLIVCHADGTTFVGRIDTRGISQADLSNAVVMMCKFRERMGV